MAKAFFLDRTQPESGSDISLNSVQYLDELNASAEEADNFLSSLDPELQLPTMGLLNNCSMVGTTSALSNTAQVGNGNERSEELRDQGQFESSVRRTSAIAREIDATVMDDGAESSLQCQLPEPHVPTMFISFVPSTGDKLKKLAANFGIKTRFLYSGRLNDIFTSFRGRIHLSKSRDSLYCVNCACGAQHVGESSQNLKVRLSEHMRNSSQSAFTYYLLNNDSHTHQPVFKDTMVLARESNGTKRKILESLCIQNKKARLCNTRVSVEISPVWSMCTPKMANQLSHTD